MTDILVIEDSIELGKTLCDFIKCEGYSCHHVINGEDGIDYINSNNVRIVILDIMLPNMDGFAVCQKIREQLNIPILVVSARISKEDKLNGLILGADDYIEKPYDIDILIAKVNAIYKRNYSAPLNCIVEGNISIDTKSRIVNLNGSPISLTIKEYELLLLLIENKGKTLNKDFIFNKIWGVDSFSEPSTLTVHIKWLRQKIEDDPREPKRLLTVWGVGYRFV